ncbi:MAG: 23S rRNA (adenine(2503)-C(2))-methyltransferase RlmN, partial [Atribacterota bacterium]|nr:23S rRNA (adenine(2503)-C(2))-methyltransferase RlmN [Atribacterota bacterium]
LSFQKILIKNHIPATIRYSKGADIKAACGQLRKIHSQSNKNS